MTAKFSRHFAYKKCGRNIGEAVEQEENFMKRKQSDSLHIWVTG